MFTSHVLPDGTLPRIHVFIHNVLTTTGDTEVQATRELNLCNAQPKINNALMTGCKKRIPGR